MTTKRVRINRMPVKEIDIVSDDMGTYALLILRLLALDRRGGWIKGLRRVNPTTYISFIGTKQEEERPYSSFGIEPSAEHRFSCSEVPSGTTIEVDPTVTMAKLPFRRDSWNKMFLCK